MSNLTQRTFLMRNVHDDAPVLFRTRWAMSYLRGPLTLAEKVLAARPQYQEIKDYLLTPAVGAHCGPKAITIGYVEKH